MMELFDTGNAISNLYMYGQKHGLKVEYKDLDSEGPDHNKLFTARFLVDGKPYPIGEGKNKPDAKLNAAHNAIRCLRGDQQQDTAEYSAETSSPARQNDMHYISWLNQYGQTNRVTVKPVETPRPGPHNATHWCKFVVGDTEYPEVSGKSKREAKEEAAKLVYEMINGVQSPEVVDSPVHQNQMVNKNLNDLSPKTKSLSINSEDNCTEPRFCAIIHNYCQRQKLSFEFLLVERTGPAHNPRFFYKLKIDTREYPVAEGKNIQEAKHNAAKLAWSALQEQSDYDSKSQMIKSMLCDKPEERPETKEHFVDKHRETLIQRVSNIEPVLDGLLQRKVLLEETYDRIRSLPTSASQLREIFSCLRAADECKDIFLSILQEKEPFLIADLQSKR